MNTGSVLENGRPGGGSRTATPGVYSLKWNSFQSHITKGLSKLLEENIYTDVTLACEGQSLQAHRILLTLCSPFFKRLFEVNNAEKSDRNTIVILNHVRFKDLESIIKFIYNGQTNVSQSDLHNFLETGELLQIEGLASSSTKSQEDSQPEGNTTVDPSSTNIQNNSNPQQLPPLPTLHSFPRVASPTPATQTQAADSRLRASLTNPSILRNQSHYHPIQSNPLKRPRLSNPTQDLPFIVPPSTSKLQSILTGQSSVSSSSGINSYASSPMIVVGSAKSLAPNLMSSSSTTMDKDPLGQYDEEEGRIDQDSNPCEPMIEMNSIKSDGIQVYNLDEMEGCVSDGEDEFEDSSQEVMMGKDSDSQDIYFENEVSMPQGAASTSRSGASRRKSIHTTVSEASNERKEGAGFRKPGRITKHKYRLCNYCGGLFYKSNLSRHMSQVHTEILLAQGKRLFRCSVCKTLYRSSGHLQTHMQKQHGDIR